MLASLVAAFAASGCSPEPALSGEKTSVQATSSSPAASPVGGTWDPASWEPTVTVTPVSLSDAEKERLRHQWLVDMAASLGLDDPPDVPLVRWAKGGVDYGDAVGSCLSEKGFLAEPDGFFGFSYPEGVPPSQEDSFSLALYTCNARYSPDPIFQLEWSADQLRLLYDYWDQFYIPCLAAHGVTVDVSERPSRESWVAAFHTPDRISWWPMDALMSLTEAELEAIQAACAAYPPDAVFYGVGG